MDYIDRLKTDIDRLAELHSWYKIPKKSERVVCPMLQMGQQPRHPISPECDPKEANTLRWWFVAMENIEDPIWMSLFESKEDMDTVLKYSKKYKCSVKRDFGTYVGTCGYAEHEAIMFELFTNAVKFLSKTKQIYDKIAMKQQVLGSLTTSCTNSFLTK